jgi:hypothetical protein
VGADTAHDQEMSLIFEVFGCPQNNICFKAFWIRQEVLLTKIHSSSYYGTRSPAAIIAKRRGLITF